MSKNLQLDTSLRQRAEEQLGEFLGADEIAGMDEARAFIRELRLHQLELEFQNEDLRQARQALEEARDQLRDLYDFAPMAYLTVEPRGRIVHANITAASLLGVPRPVLTASRLYNFIATEDQATYFEQRRLILATGKPQWCTVRILREDGRSFLARIQGNPQFDDAGELVACRTVILDLSTDNVLHPSS